MIDKCVWRQIYDEKERSYLQNEIKYTAWVSAILMIRLNISLTATNLWHDRSYRNVSNFTMVVLLRLISPMLTQLNSITHWLLPTLSTCHRAAFWDTLLNVMEVESLTHICIERYVVAKYISNGWALQLKHYSLYQFLIVLFAVLYSTPPLLGLGNYGPDFSCTTCTYNMVLPQTWQRYFMVTTFLFRSVKSAYFMLSMLYWCFQLERKYDNSKKHQKEKQHTKNAMVVTMVCLASWLPLVLIRGLVVGSQLIYKDNILSIPVGYIKFALELYEIYPAIVVFALMLADSRIKYYMTYLKSPKEIVEDNNKKTK